MAQATHRGQARVALLTAGIIGDFLFGGIIFGWNALSVVLQDLGVFAEACPPDQGPKGPSSACASQESRFASIWNAGVFAVNFGPALVGLGLDYLGVRAVAATGAAVASLGALLLGLALRSPHALLPAGAFLAGFGGLAYHMAQFHAAKLFPAHAGLVSSAYVGAFIASGIVFQFGQLIFESLGASSSAYRAILVTLAMVALVYVFLMSWMAPRWPVSDGSRYCFSVHRFHFSVDTNQWQSGGASVVHSGSNTPKTTASRHAVGVAAQADECECAHADMYTTDVRMKTCTVSTKASQCHRRRSCSSDQADLSSATSRPPGNSACHASVTSEAGRATDFAECVGVVLHSSHDPGRLNETRSMSRAMHDRQPHCSSSRPCGRWARLHEMPLRQQLTSPEFWALGAFFSLNVLALQLYLGTARAQLEGKGDSNQTYVSILSYIVPGIVIITPINGLLLDKLGFGIVLLIINTLSLGTVVFQMFPSLSLQVVTFCLWAAARFLLYSTFFAMVGRLFSFRSFGRIVGIISTVTGLLGLLQLPLADLAVDELDGDFLPLQIGSAVVVALLFVPALIMYRLEQIDRP